MNNLLSFLLVGTVLLCHSVSNSFGQQPSEALEGLEPTQEELDAIRALRKQAQSDQWEFTPIFTAVSSERLQDLTGEIEPTPYDKRTAQEFSRQVEPVEQLLKREIAAAGLGDAPTCDVQASRWDWRTHNKVTTPDRQLCSDCWAFATTGQIESAYLMAGHPESDLSEQQVNDCSGYGSCKGGQRWYALTKWATKTPVAQESVYKYENGVDKPCRTSIKGSHILRLARWIDTSNKVPPTQRLKELICEYGPISVSIFATRTLSNYGGATEDEAGVFDRNEASGNDSNHAVLLVGWDEGRKAWIIKNSWGERWGIQGFGLVRYGSNNIGKWPVVVTAEPPNFTPSAVLKDQISKLGIGHPAQ
ncbi:C1 family peptidase [Sinorhizobium meliloti]|uniref:C1 family peptidase n=1 Tax=Rhizobium meliloti TaxID=382 RepID=UPI0013E2964E|nr:C1 family peptidase [Sinorhizobium meliloti]